MDLFGKYQTELTGLISVIILGAIGTALWEVALKPSSSWLLRKLLSIATLGLDRAKIIIYKRIASGQEESFAQHIAYYLFILLSCTVVIGIIFFKFNIIDDFKNTHEKIISTEIENEKLINPNYAEDANEKLTTSQKLERIKQMAIKRREAIAEIKNSVHKIEKVARTIYIMMILTTVFMLANIWIKHMIMIYINGAIRYYNQLFRICAPLINETERLQYLSDFAQIKGPQQYKQLIESLKKVAKEHDFYVPSFWVWGYKH